MSGVKWNVSAGAVVLLALMYFFDESGIVSAAAAAALVHEAGHYALLRLCGARITTVTLGAAGLRLDYAGALRSGQTAACLAAGPAAGLLYALAAVRLGSAFGQMSGTVSLAFSCFNLLPVLPLDGGRLLCAAAGERTGRAISRAAALCLAAAGIVLFLRRRAVSAAVMGVWLAADNFRSAAHLYFFRKWYRMASLRIGRKTWTKD